MSDTASGVVIGSPTGGNPTGAGAGSPRPAQGSSGSGAEGASWFSSLTKDEGTAKLIGDKKWDSIDAVAKSYRELESAFSSRPGAPKSVADYEFSVPKGLPEGSYSKDLADGFKQVAHKHGVSKEAAAALHDWFATTTGESYTKSATARAEATSKAIADTAATLTKDWGQPDSPSFKRNAEMARRALENLDPSFKDALTSAGIMQADNTITNASVARALAKVGAELYTEDSLFGTPTSTENPFDAKTMNMAAQSKIMKQDPAKARMLIQAAGPKAIAMYKHFLEKK